MPTQNSDVLKFPGAGIKYAGPGKTWTIANGVLVGSAVSFGVHSAFNGSKLVNKGDVFGVQRSACLFQAQKNGTVINKAGASIVGSYRRRPWERCRRQEHDRHERRENRRRQPIPACVAADVSNFELSPTPARSSVALVGV